MPAPCRDSLPTSAQATPPRAYVSLAPGVFAFRALGSPKLPLFPSLYAIIPR